MRVLFSIAIMMLVVTAEAVDVIDPAEIPPGSAGVCLTEMDGGILVEIPLTVIGTLGPGTPEGEIVLVRLDDEHFEHTGIIAGMSGSPVYVEGRLLGALAFGWAFSKEPIGGVTPFGRMEGLAGSSESQVGAAKGRPGLVEIFEAGRQDRLGELLAAWLLPQAGSELHSLPVAVTNSSSWNPSGADWLADSWRRLGWVSVPGGSAGDHADRPLTPGAMVAGVLVSGDAVLAAGGTVTEVRGDQVWAFGHPFLGGGDFRIPLARAEVLTVLPSQLSSFKFFAVGDPIGSLESDRSRGVWGRLSEPPPMIPVEVMVDGRDHNFKIVRHPILTPFLVAYLAQSSQAARGRLFGEQTIDFRMEMRYAGGEVAKYGEIVASSEAPGQVAAFAAGLVAYLEGSSHAVPDLESIAITLETEERLRGAELVDIVPQRRVVRPGETLDVRLRFRPFRGEEFTRDFEIQVPLGTPAGRLDLVVADGASWTVYDLGMRPMLPASFGDEIRLVNSLLSSATVVLALERRQTGAVLRGGTVAMPPGVVIQLRVGLGPNVTTTSYAVTSKVVEAMPTTVSGAERIELLVREDERADHVEVP